MIVIVFMIVLTIPAFILDMNVIVGVIVIAVIIVVIIGIVAIVLIVSMRSMRTRAITVRPFS